MSRKEEAYNYIRKGIVTGELKGGMPILEVDLSETLHISRTPIREALRDLEAEGVVISYASRGTFVTELTPYDVEDIFDLRLLFELWALERGINRITDTELDIITQKLVDAEKSGNWDEDFHSDICLHTMIIEKSGSKRLVGFMNNLYTQVERISYRAFLNKTYNRNSFQEHMELIASIRERDLDKSREVLSRHLKAVANAAIEAFRTMRA